jgi:hypothetical protein
MGTVSGVKEFEARTSDRVNGMHVDHQAARVPFCRDAETVWREIEDSVKPRSNVGKHCRPTTAEMDATRAVWDRPSS